MGRTRGGDVPLGTSDPLKVPRFAGIGTSWGLLRGTTPGQRSGH
jgi:hypothetical protein